MDYKIFFEFVSDPKFIELPINPSEFSMTKSGNLFTYSTVLGQEIVKPTKGGLTEIKLSGVLTCNLSQTPIYYVELFQRLVSTGEQVVVSITRRYFSGQIEYITLPVLLMSINSEERGGTTDISYTLMLKEYKSAGISRVSEAELNTGESGAAGGAAGAENAPKETEILTYTVKRGDTLYTIAKRFLGDGKRFMEIARLNGIANPNLIRVGQELKLC